MKPDGLIEMIHYRYVVKAEDESALAWAWEDWLRSEAPIATEVCRQLTFAIDGVPYDRTMDMDFDVPVGSVLTLVR